MSLMRTGAAAWRRPASGPPPGSGHRAWRVLITQNDGSASFCGFTRLDMRETPGGANVIDESDRVMASFGSSQINGDNSISRAYTLDLNEGWLSATAGDSYNGWDFDQQGDGDKDINQIVIYGSWNAPDASPQDFELQWTDDDPLGTPTWTTKQSWTGETGWAAREMRVFTV